MKGLFLATIKISQLRKMGRRSKGRGESSPNAWSLIIVFLYLSAFLSQKKSNVLALSPHILTRNVKIVQTCHNFKASKFNSGSSSIQPFIQHQHCRKCNFPASSLAPTCAGRRDKLLTALYLTAIVGDNSNNRDRSKKEEQQENSPSSFSLEKDTAINGEATSQSQVLSKDQEKVPSYATILSFVSTTVLIWLSEPLLSLIDTTVVGQTSPSYQLTALGPATFVMDYSIFLTNFLAIATTNRMATAMAREDKEEQQKVISETLGVAGVVGLGLGSILLLFGKTMLFWVLGGPNAAAGPKGMSVDAVLTSALRYLRIRSLATPFAIVGMAAQSIALSCLDTRTPAVAVAAASVVNIIGDVALCKFAGLGASGAALATAFANLVSCSILMKSTRGRFVKLMDETGGKVEKSSKNSPPFVSLPDAASLLELVRLAGPVFFVLVAKCITFGAMTLRANMLGMLEVAANSIMTRVFYFFGVFADGISHAGQTFFPRVLYSEGGMEGRNGEVLDKVEDYVNGDEALNGLQAFENDTNGKAAVPKLQARKGSSRTAMQSLFSRLFVITSVVSFVSTILAARIIRYGGWMFTPDTRIISLMSRHSTLFALALGLQPFFLLMEGSIIASRDLKFLVGMQTSTIILMMLQLRWCTTFKGVWVSMLVLQILRALKTSGRVWWKQFRPSSLGANS